MAPAAPVAPAAQAAPAAKAARRSVVVKGHVARRGGGGVALREQARDDEVPGDDAPSIDNETEVDVLEEATAPTGTKYYLVACAHGRGFLKQEYLRPSQLAAMRKDA